MLDKLTKEQEALIPIIRDKWLNQFFSLPKINKKEAEKQIKWLYKFCNLKSPKVVFVDSPLAIQYFCNMIKGTRANVGDNVGNNVRDNVWANVWNNVGANVGANVRANVRDNVWDNVWNNVWANVWNNVRANVWNNVGDNVGNNVGDNVGANVRNNVGANVGDNVGDNVGANVRANVRANVGDNVGANVWNNVGANVRNNVGANVRNNVGDNVRAEKLEYTSTSNYGNISDYSWVAFYDYFQSIGIELNNPNFNEFKKLLEAGIYDMVQLDGLCVVCGNPDKINRNDQNRLHSDKEPAIKWSDGFELYYLDGINFDKNEWIGITQKVMPAKDAIAFENIEQRTVALKYLGYDNVIKELGGQVIDTFPRLGYEVIEIDLKDDDVPARFVKVVCPSTGKETILRVDPRDDRTKTCMSAISWTFDTPEEEYILEIET